MLPKNEKELEFDSMLHKMTEYGQTYLLHNLLLHRPQPMAESRSRCKERPQIIQSNRNSDRLLIFHCILLSELYLTTPLLIF